MCWVGHSVFWAVNLSILAVVFEKTSDKASVDDGMPKETFSPAKNRGEFTINLNFILSSICT